jgi:hypothetical protein
VNNISNVKSTVEQVTLIYQTSATTKLMSFGGSPVTSGRASQVMTFKTRQAIVSGGYEPAMVAKLLRLKAEPAAKVFDIDNDLMNWLDNAGP